MCHWQGHKNKPGICYQQNFEKKKTRVQFAISAYALAHMPNMLSLWSH